MECDYGIDPNEYLDLMTRAFVSHYADHSDVWTDDPQMRALAIAIAELGTAQRDARVLDIGCGIGRDVEFFARAGAQAVGIDIVSHASWEAIARDCAGARFEAVDFLHFDATELFDVVVDNGCFHHQHPEHRRQYLERVVELLAPQGWFVLSTFENDQQSSIVDDRGRIHTYYTESKLHAQLDGVGLRVEREEHVWRPKHQDHYRWSMCRVEDRAI